MNEAINGQERARSSLLEVEKVKGRVELATGDSEEEVDTCKFITDQKLTRSINIDSQPAT